MCMLMSSFESLKKSAWSQRISLELSRNVNSGSLGARCVVAFYFFPVLFYVF